MMVNNVGSLGIERLGVAAYSTAKVPTASSSKRLTRISL
jgi:hypothetical protein